MYKAKVKEKKIKSKNKILEEYVLRRPCKKKEKRQKTDVGEGRSQYTNDLIVPA